MNDPGTAIDVIGRGVRILSTYTQNKSDEIEVKYPSVHVAPLQNNDLLEDFSHLSRAMVPV
ncbi:membrane protein-like domain protein [Escherichia coli UMNF18]|nr:membrane protein-like domain protein [Escherichia coli UMNF18]